MLDFVGYMIGCLFNSFLKVARLARADLVRFPGSFGVCCFIGGCWVALRWCLGVRSVADGVLYLSSPIYYLDCLFIG